MGGLGIMIGNTFKNKKVLITGHTGFKGSWLTIWLLKLGAKVVGISDSVKPYPSMFSAAKLDDKINHKICDIRNYDDFKEIIENENPDFIFHLAAQAIVSESYKNPLDTITTNVLGVANLLDILKTLNKKIITVVVTSDKCYENVEWVWGYKETDHLGGKDIYSGSKGAAEIIFHSYYESFFGSKKSNALIATGRAGNVIGGGDWSKDRIIADCMKNWSVGKPIEIRSPEATRPWQHVLEPLGGYLLLASNLYYSNKLNGQSYNFGPRSEQTRTVLDLIKSLFANTNFKLKDFYIAGNKPFSEAGLLKLNCDKALHDMDWSACLDYDECISLVGDWYKEYYRGSNNIFKFTLNQISFYEKKALERGLKWIM